MAIAEVDLPFQRVAVLDDSDRDAETLHLELKAIGLEPVEIAIDNRELEDIVVEVQARAEAAICDHYLQGHKRVSFTGAEAVARFTELAIPTCLITMYAMDGDVDIRRHRGLIPSLLLRSDADVDDLAAALRRSYDELRTGPTRDRIPYRTTVSVQRVADEASEPVVDVLVGGWREDEIVRFPVAMLPEELIPDDHADLQGMILFAAVNLGAARSLDLFFQGFEPAPASTLAEDLIRDAPLLDWGTMENGA